MIKKVTDWFWVMPIQNTELMKKGWREYQMVEAGNGIRLSIARTVESGLSEIHEIASGIETMDRAISLANEYDGDNYGNYNLIVIAIAVIMIPLSVWLIAELT